MCACGIQSMSMSRLSFSKTGMGEFSQNDVRMQQQQQGSYTEPGSELSV